MAVCHHSYTLDPDHPDYEMCLQCDTWHSLIAPPAEEIYTSDYWSHNRGHSTIEEQVHNVEVHQENGVSKNEFVMRHVDAKKNGWALEIGCAPGSLLNRLKYAGFSTVYGIDAHESFRKAINAVAMYNAYLEFGLFPDVTKKWVTRFDCIVACDVFEHSHKPWPFLLECSRLLNMGGQLILILPLATLDIPDRMFNAEEHVFIHSLSNLSAMMASAGLKYETVSRWCPGHDMVTARRIEMPINELRAA